MSALTGFCDSDTLRIQALEFNLDGPVQVAGAKTRPPMCVRKAVGDVGFKLSARDHLDLYSAVEIKISFDENIPSETHENPDILLDLVPDGPPVTYPGGRIRQAFTVDEKPGLDIRYTGLDVHVDSIQGRIVLDLVERIPWAETTGCQNEPRYVRADIESVPAESALEIRGSASGVGATLRATSLAISGSAAASGFDVSISVHRSECGHVGVVPGGRQHFAAWVDKVPVGYARTFAWTVAGGTIIGPTNLPHIDVQLSNLPDPDPDPVHVQVRIEVAGLSAVATVDFKPDTPAESLSKEIRCKVQRHLWHNFHVDPLWDPLRDYVARPLTRPEVVRLHEAATALLRTTEQLLEHERG